MSQELQVNDVVWAKLHSFPWWPAIITEINTQNSEKTLYRVDFISENTHYLLTKKHVKLFEGNIKLPTDSNKKSKQYLTLQKAIVIAHKINCGELQKSDLHRINLLYFSKEPKEDLPKKRASKEVEKKLRSSNLEKKIDQMVKNVNLLPEELNIETNLVSATQSSIKKNKKILLGFIKKETCLDNISNADLLDAFEKLLEYDPHKEILKNTFVVKALKYFAKEFLNSQDYRLALLGKLADQMYLYWKNAALKECLKDIKENYKEYREGSSESDAKSEKNRKGKLGKNLEADKVKKRRKTGPGGDGNNSNSD